MLLLDFLMLKISPFFQNWITSLGLAILFENFEMIVFVRTKEYPVCSTLMRTMGRRIDLSSTIFFLLMLSFFMLSFSVLLLSKSSIFFSRMFSMSSVVLIWSAKDLSSNCS